MKRIISIAIVLTPLIAYIYIWYLSIVLFLIPAFKTYFALYGVWGTFGIWAALTVAGFFCGFFGSYLWANFKQGYNHETS